MTGPGAPATVIKSLYPLENLTFGLEIEAAMPIKEGGRRNPIVRYLFQKAGPPLNPEEVKP